MGFRLAKMVRDLDRNKGHLVALEVARRDPLGDFFEPVIGWIKSADKQHVEVAVNHPAYSNVKHPRGRDILRVPAQKINPSNYQFLYSGGFSYRGK